MTPVKTAARLTRKEQREQTRSRLLAAAQRLFVAQGFAGTSVEDIAEAAGYTRGAFYSNFEDKDDLFLALLDESLANRVAELNELAGESASLPDFFGRIIRSNESREMRRTTILHTEFWLYAARNPHVRKKLAERQRNELRAFERAIEAQFKTVGLEPPVDIHEAGYVLLALDTAIPRLKLTDPEDVPDNFFFKAVLQLFEAAQALAREKARQK